MLATDLLRSLRGGAALCVGLPVVLAVCGRSPDPVQLVITGADALDVRTGTVRRDRTIVVDDGRILDVLPAFAERPAAVRTVEADGRLVVPGFLDAHSHLAYLLGDSLSAGGGLITRLSSAPDSIDAYRHRYASQYLPYGVTSVRDAGSSAADLRLMLRWMENPGPDLPDIHPAGGALVSHEQGRTPFPGHRVVEDRAAAAATVREYHEMGLSQVKLYWRMNEPEFRAALDEARRLGMNVTGHIDFQVMDEDVLRSAEAEKGNGSMTSI